MKLQIISTGGTFNKVYNEATGLFDIDEMAVAAREIIELSRGNLECYFVEIIHKDSNFFTDNDREKLLESVFESKHENIVIIHGTDTMDKSSEYLNSKLPFMTKRVVFVGAMKPFHVQKDEAIFNLATAVGFLNAEPDKGIYISMHGLVLPFDKIVKDRSVGIFSRKGIA